MPKKNSSLQKDDHCDDSLKTFANATHQNSTLAGITVFPADAKIKVGEKGKVGIPATQGYVLSQFDALTNSAPKALNTLKELALSIGEKANFKSYVDTELSNKVVKNEYGSVISNALQGTPPFTVTSTTEVANLNAATASNAKLNSPLDIFIKASQQAFGITAPYYTSAGDKNVATGHAGDISGHAADISGNRIGAANAYEAAANAYKEAGTDYAAAAAYKLAGADISGNHIEAAKSLAAYKKAGIALSNAASQTLLQAMIAWRTINSGTAFTYWDKAESLYAQAAAAYTLALEPDLTNIATAASTIDYAQQTMNADSAANQGGGGGGGGWTEDSGP